MLLNTSARYSPQKPPALKVSPQAQRQGFTPEILKALQDEYRKLELSSENLCNLDEEQKLNLGTSLTDLADRAVRYAGGLTFNSLDIPPPSNLLIDPNLQEIQKRLMSKSQAAATPPPPPPLSSKDWDAWKAFQKECLDQQKREERARRFVDLYVKANTLITQVDASLPKRD
ncbi:MAG: hypothetical protein ACK5T0_06340 [Vampirovibrionales bacterium]